MKINLILVTNIILMVFASPKAHSQFTESQIEDPVAYFNKRTEAISLAKNEKWQELVPILEDLVQQYQMDGDLFYVLGLSYYETEEYQNAIEALKKTLELGGTILVVPTGSSPTNDIMIKIAKAYALEGDKQNTIMWLKKGISARYDEKPFLKWDPAFESLKEDKDFLNLFNANKNEDFSREQAWLADLAYLKKRISEEHYAVADVISEKDFVALFDELASSINSMSDEQVVVSIMKIMGRLGSGHNFIIPTSSKVGALKKLPIQMYHFEDGLFIVDADEEHIELIGYKVEKIGSSSIEYALEKTNEVNARDNDMQTLWQGPYFLSMPSVLTSLGISENDSITTLELIGKNGDKKKVALVAKSWNFTGFPKLPPLKRDSQALYLSNMDDIFWHQTIFNDSTLYIQFNNVQDKENKSLEVYTIELQEIINQKEIQSLILDLRHNSGGNGAIRKHMLKLLVSFNIENPHGKIFVLMGRNTYSAAQNLLTEISNQTNAILVGEPSGSKPSAIGEAGWFQLPYSGLMGITSSQFHQSSESEDFRNWIAPHVPISLSSTDYFSGNDKAMDVIMKIIKFSEKETKN